MKDSLMTSALTAPDDDVPMPTKRQTARVRSGPMRSWESMKVGQSYFIELPDGISLTKHQQRVSANCTTWARLNGSPFKFRTAQVEEHDPAGVRVVGVRVWRKE